MTIEEAIARYKEYASESRKHALELARKHVYDSARIFQQSAIDYERVASWLSELKSIKAEGVAR